MQVKDLGELQGDVLIFGGPCSNLQATEALIAAVRERGIPESNAVCTGDVVAYCGRQVAAGEMGRGCGFEAGSACDLLSAGWYALCDRKIGAEDRAWMRSLPDRLAFTHAGRRVMVVHGAASHIARFLWQITDEKEFQEEIAVIEAESGPVDIVIAGHSGIPFVRGIGSVQWVNAGVIGMSPHDGRSETRYAVLGTDGVAIHRLSYDADIARAFMEAAGLRQGYHESLTTGIWPSEDILSAQMRRSGISATC